MCLNFKKTFNNYSAREEEKDLINYIIIFVIEFYLILLDSNNFAFIEKFLHSDLFKNLASFDDKEDLKTFFGNLYYVIFQTIIKPSPRFELLETLFSEKRVVSHFEFVLINSQVSSVYRLNLLMNFDLLVKEIGKNFDSDSLEEYANLFPRLFGYLNDLSEKVSAK